MSVLINPYRFASAAVGPYGNHAYWRLFVNSNHGDGSFTDVGELQFQDSNGSAISTTGGSYVDSATTASFAFDGNDGSSGNFWAGATTNSYVGYHFPTAVGVAKIALTNVNSTGQNCSRAVKTGRLQYSDDGSSWTDAFTFVQDSPVVGTTRTFPADALVAGQHRAWRVFVETNNGDGSAIVVNEIELRATSGGADQTSDIGTLNPAGTTAGRVIGSTIGTAGGQGYLAYNNSDTGAWVVLATTNQWVGFVFPNPVAVQEVLLRCTSGSSGSNARSPNIVRIEYADDETPTASTNGSTATWTQQKRITGLTWAVPESKVLAAI